MNIKHNILVRTVLCLLACSSFHACLQDDGIDLDSSGSAGDLVAEGRYLSAFVPETFASSDVDRGEWFESGTPYRLFAFSQEYGGLGRVAVQRAETFRFNTVAWEDSLFRNGVTTHFINIDSEPEKWFGFKALPGETPGVDSLVALDFYGLSYGKEEPRENYIPTLPEGSKNIHAIYRTEAVGTDNVLKDLLRAQLLDCTIANAAAPTAGVTQSVLPFKHCFSRLRFLVVQEAEDEPDANGDPVPCFGDIRVESVKLTGTYESGNVYLEDGKIALPSDTIHRKLSFGKYFTDLLYKVPTQQVEMGRMIIFPSDGACLKDVDGTGFKDRASYSMGLEITVKSKTETTLDKFLAGNTSGEADTRVSGPDTDGWYRVTLTRPIITDNYDTVLPSAPLYFKQNNAYTLVIAFMNNAVRIITVVPTVEEWLQGEIHGTDDDPEYWDDQEVGQPQMFDNVVWCDRNLGAGDPDPENGDFEKSMGYFYQAGRNIPYYPFNFNDFGESKVPTGADVETTQDFGDQDTGWKAYGAGDFKFYPIVDKSILKMDTVYNDWVIASGETPQMSIPETQPDAYFDFMSDSALGDNDMKWNEGQQNQPATGAWVIPTSAQFMSIFPTTPYAGNITFRKGDYNDQPMDWCAGNDPGINNTKTLRVTVPYYKSGSTDADKPTWKSELYQKAWLTLHDNHDAGTTHESSYYVSPGNWTNVKLEPDGDPSDGYASVYVISREREEDIVSFTPGKKANLCITEWGTIYGIKRIYTAGAYRMRWRALIADETLDNDYNPGIYIEVCRYRCSPDETLDETNYKELDWDHPAARLFFPVTGLGDHTGVYINFGTECQYATSDPIIDGKTSALQIKITGDNATNAYIAIVKGAINRHFGMQIRPVAKGGV